MGISMKATYPTGQYAGTLDVEQALRHFEIAGRDTVKATAKQQAPSLILGCPSRAELDLSKLSRKVGARYVALDQPGDGATQDPASYRQAWRSLQRAIAASEENRSQWRCLVVCVNSVHRSPVCCAFLVAALAGPGDTGFDVEQAVAWIRLAYPDIRPRPGDINQAEKALRAVREAADELKAAEQDGVIRSPWWPFDRH